MLKLLLIFVPYFKVHFQYIGTIIAVAVTSHYLCVCMRMYVYVYVYMKFNWDLMLPAKTIIEAGFAPYYTE